MRIVIIGVMVGTLGIALDAQPPETFAVNPAGTNITVHVGRAGLFGFAAHDHEIVMPGVKGEIVVDRADVARSRLLLEFDAAALKVTGKGEPAEDVPEVQRVMLSDRVLDVQRYPTIVFQSKAVSPAGPATDTMTLRVTGPLTLHGVTQSVTVPVQVQFAAGRLTASGKVTVRQSAFGIKPVTAGAGTVRVKDDVDVVFTVAAGRP